METTTALSQLAGRGDLDAQFRLGYRLMFCRDRLGLPRFRRHSG